MHYSQITTAELTLWYLPFQGLWPLSQAEALSHTMEYRRFSGGLIIIYNHKSSKKKDWPGFLLEFFVHLFHYVRKNKS